MIACVGKPSANNNRFRVSCVVSYPLTGAMVPAASIACQRRLGLYSLSQLSPRVPHENCAVGVCLFGLLACRVVPRHGSACPGAVS